MLAFDVARSRSGQSTAPLETGNRALVYSKPMAEPAYRPPMTDSEDPFYWGSRRVRVADPNGGTRWREVPLTRDDVLDPQEGDMMVQGSRHALEVQTLADMLRRWFEPAGDVAVFSDLKMLWDVPGLAKGAPDVAIVRGLRDRDRDRASFSVAEEGVRPCLVIEVVSRRYAEIDYGDKVSEYRRAGVAEYLIVDFTGGALELTGFRLDSAGRYRKSAPGRRRWRSHTTGLEFSVGPDRGELVVRDVETGHRLLTSDEEAAARQAAEEELARLRERIARFEEIDERQDPSSGV